MIKGINYWAFPSDRNGSPLPLVDAMKYARDLGYDSFEPTVDGEGAPLTLSTRQGDVEAFRKAADDIGINILTVASGLAWGASPTDPNATVRRRACEDTKQVLTVASWLGAETILYLPGMVSAVFVPDFTPQPYDKVDEWARESMQEILPAAEKTGVRIGIENVWNRFLLSPLEMKNFIDSFDSPYVGSYFDVGNCMLYGHPVHWIEILRERIFAVHMKDFRVEVGNLNGFVDLLAGDVDFVSVLRAFKRIGYDGQFAVEYVPPTLGAAEKGIASMKLIEKIQGEV